MKKYFDVRCPYCFEQLRYNDAVFRCKSGDEQEDKYLKNYKAHLEDKQKVLLSQRIYFELFDLHDLRILRKAFLYLEDQSVWRLSGLPVSEMRRTARDNDKHGWII